MHAIIEDSGTQIRVASGDVLDIDLRDRKDVPGEASNKTITFDRVLLVGKDGGTAEIGTPYVKGATVTAEVLDEVRGEKLDVIKYKRRKGFRVKRGHRQRYLRVEIKEIRS